MHDGTRLLAVFSGGGTGGHLYPALTLAQALRKERPDVRALFVGSSGGIEARVLPKGGLDYLLLPVRGFRRGEVLRNWSFLPGLVRSLVALGLRFREESPDMVVVTGGYAGAPAGIVAALMGIPLVLQEQNSVPGLTTRWLSRWAKQLHLAFPEAVELLPPRGRGRTFITGNPTRETASVGIRDARARLGLAVKGEVVLAVGGSQGSAALNRLLLEALAKVGSGALPRPGGLQLLWVTGPAHLGAVRGHLGGEPPPWVHLRGYLDDMPTALGAATLAVSRAGALATSEFLARGLPAILIPYPTAAADHQHRNAMALAEAGAAVLLRERGLGGETLWSGIAALVEDRERREKMAREAASRGRPGATTAIARAIAELLPAPPSAPRSGGAPPAPHPPAGRERTR